MDEATSVLFVSRRNSLRSVLAQACLQHVGRDRFKAYSCGVPGQVAAAVHEVALRALAAAGIPFAPEAPRSWAAFLYGAAPRLDLVILLDPLSDVELPRWPDQPDLALWKYPDALAGGGDPKLEDALQILHSLRRRLEILANLPMRGVDRAALSSDIREISRVW